MKYEIKVFSELNSELKEYWVKLETNSNNYCFQSYDWFENWVNVFQLNNKNNSICIIVILLKSEVFGIIPFQIEAKSSLKILKWAGTDQSDYCGPILNKKFLTDKETFIDLWKQIIKSLPSIDLIYLNKQPKSIEKIDNPFVSCLKNYKDSNTYNILLPNSWDDYVKKILKKNFFLQNERKKKQLKKAGKLKFKIATSKEEKNKFLNELILQKNIKLKLSDNKNIFKENSLNFYKNFENANLSNIKTHLCALSLNEELIAIHWGVIYKKRFYYLLLSMKEGELDRYSPGRLLISLLIRWSISKKIKIFDFTLGEENYKKSWSNSTDELYNYIKLITLRGFILYYLIKIKLIIKSLDNNNLFKKTAFFIKKIF